MSRKAEITLEFQNYIEAPPVSTDRLYGTAARNDDITVKSWRGTWLAQIKANKKRFGSFKDYGVGKLFDKYAKRPAIIAGAGPSLKHNGHLLKDRGDIALFSCLHNFHFFEDQEIYPDYYVTLDAGDITVGEVSEGGKYDPEYYWNKTKDKKLIAYIGTSPLLLEKWQGEIYFFNAPMPDESLKKEINEIEEFHTYISNGGNVLGACLYAAKGICGANPIAFVGADFCFSYDKKFHAWDSKYDANLGHVMRTNDVYGNKVLTWASYMGFKSWFDFVAIKVPGIWINCTEGGTFGAYPDGNIMAVKQMELQEFLDMYSLNRHIKDQCLDPENAASKGIVLF
jgi:hypothetical protein